MVLLEMKDCAEKLGVSISTFWRMRKDFPIRTYHLGKKELIDQRDLDEWFISEERNAFYENLRNAR